MGGAATTGRGATKAAVTAALGPVVEVVVVARPVAVAVVTAAAALGPGPGPVVEVVVVARPVAVAVVTAAAAAAAATAVPVVVPVLADCSNASPCAGADTALAPVSFAAADLQ